MTSFGLFSLSSVPDDERLQRGLGRLGALGIQAMPPLPMPALRTLAGDDATRLSQFEELLMTPGLDALMATRGGYGVTRILDGLDWELLRSRDLPIIGYSDVSALHLAALRHGCLHHILGPMLCSTFGRELKTPADQAAYQATMDSFQRCLAGEACPLLPGTQLHILKPGKALGPIVPCNLTLLSALIGTPNMPNLNGCILAIEDVHEPAHSVDRMLQHLKSAGILGKIAGLIFGQFTDSEDGHYLTEIFQEFASAVHGPVVSDLPFGHDFPIMSLRVGAEVILEAEGEVRLESAPGDAYQSRIFQTSNGTMGCRILPPAEPVPGQRYPLILFLHGAGERGCDNRAQLVHVVREFLKPETRAQFPCYVIAPQCPEGAQWVDTPWNLKAHTMSETPSKPMQSALEMLDQVLGNYPIDRSRIYLMGISMGGYGVWDLAQRYPGRWAAAVPICGGGDTALAPRLSRLPIWAFHGALDNVVPTQRTLDMCAALQASGASPRMTIFPETYHDSWSKAIHTPELLPWLFSQKKQD